MREKDRTRTEYGRTEKAAAARGTSSSTKRQGVSVSKNAADAVKRQRSQGRGFTASGRAPAPQTALTPKEERALRRIEKDKKWSEGITRVRSGPDTIFLILVILIVSIGVIMVYSASYPMAIYEKDNGFYYAGKQLVWVAVGSVIMLSAMFIPARVVRNFSGVAYGLVAILLILVLAIGEEGGGAKRWIDITSSVRLQPSELAKFSLPILLAWYCEKYGHLFRDAINKRSRFFYGVFFPSLPVLLYAGLIAFEKHLSGLFIVVAIAVVVMFLGGAPVWMSAGYYGTVGFFGILAYLVMNPYALLRIKTFFDEEADNLAENWQTYQGTLAIGSGGFLGLGLGQSRQKYSYVSEAQNDFVFTIWCEEMGFVGAVLVIVLFMALIYRGYRIALKAPDTFSSLMVFGIMTQVGIQVVLNLLVVTDNFMNTGISLPFLSYGGSSLIVLMAEMGLVLSVSRRSYEKK